MIAALALWGLTGCHRDKGDTGDVPEATDTPLLAFETVARVPYAADLVPLPDGTLLVATLLGDLLHLDPATGETLDSATLMDPGDVLLGLALDPRFGDGTHDHLYAYGSRSGHLLQVDLSLAPFTLSNPTTVLDLETGHGEGHCGGGLTFWQGETDLPALYLGVGVLAEGSAQDTTTLNRKLVALSVEPDTLGQAALSQDTDDPRIVASGLRNPWRVRDCGARLCVSDPGDHSYEEVELYDEAGRNYGFPHDEGPGTSRFDDPSFWWADDDDTFPTQDALGSGHVGFAHVPWTSGRISGAGYGGALDGKVLVGDFFDGWIRTLDIAESGQMATGSAPAGHLAFVTSVVEAPDGTLYLSELGGTVRRVVLRSEAEQQAAEGASLDELPYAEATPYTVRYPLWSNGADKERRVWLPEGATIDPSTSPWTWPDGAMLFKDFAVNGEPIETRVLEKRDGRWLGATYRWEGGVATATDGLRAEVSLGGGDSYTLPSDAACEECHAANRDADWPLGLQPVVLGDEGLADVAALLSSDPGPAPTPEGDAATAEVRGYLHSNCAFCHSPEGVVASATETDLDLSYDAEIDLEAVAQYFHANANAEDGAPLFNPESPDDSVLVQVMEQGLMPPVGISTPDDDGIEAIRAWISGL